jgi:hypothetical protein
MSKLVPISSSSQFADLLASTTVVITDCELAIHPACSFYEAFETQQPSVSAVTWRVLARWKANAWSDSTISQFTRTGVGHARSSLPSSRLSPRSSHNPTKWPLRRSTWTNSVKSRLPMELLRKSAMSACPSFIGPDAQLFCRPVQVPD